MTDTGPFRNVGFGGPLPGRRVLFQPTRGVTCQGKRDHGVWNPRERDAMKGHTNGATQVTCETVWLLPAPCAICIPRGKSPNHPYGDRGWYCCSSPRTVCSRRVRQRGEAARLLR